MAINIKTNVTGTTAASFGIGKGGITVYQGPVDPNTAGLTAMSGDLYVLKGQFPQLFQYNINTWSVIADASPSRQPFSRTTFTTETYTAAPTDYYIGARYYSGPATVVLPRGVQNKTYIIKDELGLASNYPITIQSALGQTIDGQNSITIDTSFSSVTIVFGDEWHII